MCALDCPDACSLLVRIEGDRAVRLQGDPSHPITRGFLCSKVTRYLDREYSPERILYPQRRVGGKGEGQFARISWDEALDEIADRLRRITAEYGTEAVLPYSYGGNLGFLNGEGMDRRFFHRLGATRLDRTICATAGSVGLTMALGKRVGTAPEDFVHSRLIIAWGANILATNVHLWPFVVEARRRGARFIVIDPVRTRTAALADQHLVINPGSDLALALGLMHVIFAEGLEDRAYLADYTENEASLREEVRDYTPERVAQWTGIPAETVIQLARDYATVKPAVIRLNYGVQRSERGATAVRAIALLPAVTGGWRHQGGGMQLSTSGAFQVDRAGLGREDLQQLSPLGRPARILNMSRLGEALLDVNDPPVKSLIVYNSNPAAVAPDQNRVLAGLRREDLFTVVLEQFPSDTALLADIVLPATTFLENTDLYFAYGHYYIQMSRPALPAPGEAKSNVEAFRLLAKRMGFEDPCFDETEDDMIRGLLNSGHPNLEGITLERLDRERFVRLNVSPEGQPYLPFAQGGFATPTGRCDLSGAGLAYIPPVESRHGSAPNRERYPLELVSAKIAEGMNSTFSYRADFDELASRVWIHPADAANRSIGPGDWVRLFNERGSLRLQAEITPDTVNPGMVRAPAVRSNRCSPDGRNINVLTSDRLTDLGGGATFYNCLVQIERCEPPAGVTV